MVPIAAFIDHNFSIPHDFCTHGSPHNLLGATPPQQVCVRRAPPESRVVRSWPHFWPEDAAIDPSPRNRSHYNSDRCRPAAPAHHRCTHISRRKDGGGKLETEMAWFPGFHFYILPASSRRASSTTVTVFSEKTSYIHVCQDAGIGRIGFD